jgi:hypothetical protein
MRTSSGSAGVNIWKTLLFLCLPFATFAQMENTLSSKEKSNGFKLLFDGSHWMAGEVITTVQRRHGAWRMESSLTRQEKISSILILLLMRKYGDFELLFDWKVENGANSGLIYRIEEGNYPSYESGPEYQLIDDKGYKSKLELSQLSGSSYDMYPPSADVAKPAGQFNSSRIVAKGNHVEHYLNGTKGR